MALDPEPYIEFRKAGSGLRIPNIVGPFLRESIKKKSIRIIEYWGPYSGPLAMETHIIPKGSGYLQVHLQQIQGPKNL